MKKVKNNSRTLPAILPQEAESKLSLSWKTVTGMSILLFSFSFTLILIGLMLNTYELYKQEVAEKDSVVKNLNYWNGVVQKYPHFPAAYYEAAVYAARLEEREQAKDLLKKALMIDPNFFEAEALAKELE